VGTGLEGEDDDSILWNQLGSKCGMNHSMIPACCRRWNTQNPETLIVAVHERLCFCSLAFVCFFLSLLHERILPCWHAGERRGKRRFRSPMSLGRHPFLRFPKIVCVGDRGV
jgi:hypothetical protein